MALADFWNDVRARNPLFHEGVSPPDVPRVTADELDGRFAADALLAAVGDGSADADFPTPLTGYDPNDFAFLSDDRREALTNAVTSYNAAVAELAARRRGAVPPHPSPKDGIDLHRQLRHSLRDIILLIEQDRYRTPDALRYGKLVEHELGDQLPDGVVELRCNSSEDSAGDSAIWLWAFLSDEATADNARLLETGRRVRPILRSAARIVAPDRYPYILFRGMSERVEEEVAA